MKLVQAQHGDWGYAAVMRLLEVMTEQCGGGEHFNPVLTLAGAKSKEWLAQEICTPRSHGPNEMPCVDEDDLDSLLETCMEAGLVALGTVKQPGRQKVDGQWIEGEYLFDTIEVPGFSTMQDEWTARKQKKARASGGLRPTE